MQDGDDITKPPDVARVALRDQVGAYVGGHYGGIAKPVP